ncbi:MAG: hypothetical protein JSV87_00775 [Candidatus Bathyarchaeota archaeon]|nr:MAG: hypothetical protein JSV87_00775 [Candidatus Bathyarchaeota archaeon]
MIWIERFFNLLPISKKVKVQISVRLFFLFAVWLSGLAAFALDGQAVQYTSNVLFILLFGSYLLILVGTFFVQNSLGDTVLSVRPLLNVDDSQFNKLLGRIEWYSYSVIPYLLLTVILFVRPLSQGAVALFSRMLFEGFLGIWSVCFAFFSTLLSATGLWVCVSIWLTTYLVSRQPIQMKLSPETTNKFRGLTVLGLQFAAIYFLGVSFGVIFPLPPIRSLSDVILSPIVPFTAIGLIGVFIPFYNIHRTLLSLKRKELSKIQSEFKHLETTLNGILTEPDDQLGDQSTGARTPERSLETLITAGTIAVRIFNLQVRERRVRAFQEWPIDTGFISKLLGLGLAPVAAKIIQEILSRFSS